MAAILKLLNKRQRQAGCGTEARAWIDGCSVIKTGSSQPMQKCCANYHSDREQSLKEVHTLGSAAWPCLADLSKGQLLAMGISCWPQNLWDEGWTQRDLLSMQPPKTKLCLTLLPAEQSQSSIQFSCTTK